LDLRAALEPPLDTAELLDIVPELSSGVGYAASYLRLLVAPETDEKSVLARLAARRLAVEDPGGGRVESRRERSHPRGRRR
jgi:hypothetical protein